MELLDLDSFSHRYSREKYQLQKCEANIMTLTNGVTSRIENYLAGSLSYSSATFQDEIKDKSAVDLNSLNQEVDRCFAKVQSDLAKTPSNARVSKLDLANQPRLHQLAHKFSSGLSASETWKGSVFAVLSTLAAVASFALRKQQPYLRIASLSAMATSACATALHHKLTISGEKKQRDLWEKSDDMKAAIANRLNALKPPVKRQISDRQNQPSFPTGGGTSPNPSTSITLMPRKKSKGGHNRGAAGTSVESVKAAHAEPAGGVDRANASPSKAPEPVKPERASGTTTAAEGDQLQPSLETAPAEAPEVPASADLVSTAASQAQSEPVTPPNSMSEVTHAADIPTLTTPSANTPKGKHSPSNDGKDARSVAAAFSANNHFKRGQKR